MSHEIKQRLPVISYSEPYSTTPSKADMKHNIVLFTVTIISLTSSICGVTGLHCYNCAYSRRSVSKSSRGRGPRGIFFTSQFHHHDSCRGRPKRWLSVDCDSSITEHHHHQGRSDLTLTSTNDTNVGDLLLGLRTTKSDFLPDIKFSCATFLFEGGNGGEEETILRTCIPSVSSSRSSGSAGSGGANESSSACAKGTLASVHQSLAAEDPVMSSVLNSLKNHFGGNGQMMMEVCTCATDNCNSGGSRGLIASFGMTMMTPLLLIPILFKLFW